MRRNNHLIARPYSSQLQCKRQRDGAIRNAKHMLHPQELADLLLEFEKVPLHDIRAARQDIVDRCKKLILMLGVETVSYTHLDVYKRQRQDHPVTTGMLRRIGEYVEDPRI